MIQQAVSLACSPERAFRLFTEHAGAWWPAERRHTRDPTSFILMQPSGRFWERAQNGHEVELGRVTHWDFGRQLRLDFYVGTGPEAPTELVVDFVSEGAGTRVTVSHRPGRAADLWQLRVALFERSWAAVLGALARAAIDGLALQ